MGRIKHGEISQIKRDEHGTALLCEVIGTVPASMRCATEPEFRAADRSNAGQEKFSRAQA